MEKWVHMLPKGEVDPAAHRSKANKQARLVERRVCFISDASSWWGWGWGQTSVQRLTSPHSWQPVGQGFL